MFQTNRSKRVRSVHPTVASLEGRELLSTMLPHQTGEKPKVAHVFDVKHHAVTAAKKAKAPTISIINKVVHDGYLFVNFNLPDAGTMGGLGTNMNGISNSGTAVGVSLLNNGNFANFTTNPFKSTAVTMLNINGSQKAMAIGANSRGIVVGSDGNNNAFFDNRGKVTTFIPSGGTAATALGINDNDVIVGQYTNKGGAMPGFIRVSSKSFVTINAPSGPDTVNAQGINNKDLVVGFYVGTDMQDHGFVLNAKGAKSGSLTGVAVADPQIVPVEKGATFVFSQILGVNDKGIAVGYYGDSTLSQHGYFYNTHTGHYTFLDDPSEAFDNGVEVTQITGITNSGEITGFYTDANGVAHGFVAKPITG